MSLDGPSWLEDEPLSPPAEAAPPARAQGGDRGGGAEQAPPPASAPPPAPAAMAAVDDEKLPGVIMVMRLANMAVAGALIAVSIVTMVGLPGISTWVLSIYATCGGILVCCLETQLKFLRVAIAMNFGFLFSSGLRFMFYVLMAMISWTYGRVFGPVVALALVAVALFNAYVIWRYPSYRAVRERIAEEEDRRIEARINSEVKKQAIRHFTST